MTDPADALLARAAVLVGRELGSIATDFGVSFAADAVRAKGAWGGLVERALGATGGSSKVRDFPDLGIELKTIPTDERGRPVESTYVCTLDVGSAEGEEWQSSWARAKLERVLFVPLVGERGTAWRRRRVGEPLLWSPSREQDDVLRADFEDIVGLLRAGRVAEIDARRGRWLQVRPKARDGRQRTIAWGSDGEPIATVPRGLYLRARFTGAILVNPLALPD